MEFFVISTSWVFVNWIEAVALTFIAGERDYGSVEIDLKTAVSEFNSALVQFGHGVGFKVFELLQGKPESSQK